MLLHISSNQSKPSHRNECVSRWSGYTCCRCSVFLKSLPEEFIETMQKSGGTGITIGRHYKGCAGGTNLSGDHCRERVHGNGKRYPRLKPTLQLRTTSPQPCIATSARRGKGAPCGAIDVLPLDTLDTDVPGDYKHNENFIIAKKAWEGQSNTNPIHFMIKSQV